MLTELARALNSSPNYLYFMVTSRCNAFCDFCWNWKNVADAGKLHKPGDPIRRRELTLEEIDRFTRKLPKMLLVDLFGGEPFIREDLKEIIGLFVTNAKTKYISIPTNGYYTDKILADIRHSVSAYREAFFRVYISIDGPPQIHNRIRKLKNGYENAMKTAEGLFELKKGFPNLSVSCNLNYNRMTAPYMEAFVKEVLEMRRFDSVNVNIVRGNPCDPSMLEVDRGKYFAIQDMVWEHSEKSDQPFSLLHRGIERRTARIVREALTEGGPRRFNCYAVKKITLVTDQGDVFPCEEMLDRNLGNIRDYDCSLPELLRSAAAREARASIVAKECNCRWECAISTSSIFDPKVYPELLLSVVKNEFSR